MDRGAIDAYLQHVMRVRNGVISGEDSDRDRFEIYFNPLLVGPDPNPDLALEVVVELLEAAPDDESLAYIAAGPVQAVVIDAGSSVFRSHRIALVIGRAIPEGFSRGELDPCGAGRREESQRDPGGAMVSVGGER